MGKRAKRATRANPREDRNLQIIEFPKKRRVDIIPRSINQEEFLLHLDDPDIYITLGVGPAGTGKTLLATLSAIKAYKYGEVNKIVITRPNVAVDDRDIGYLPGDMFEKMMPWVRPILDIFEEYFSTKEIQRLIEEGYLEICPIAYIRGRTFKHSFIIVDEAQGTTKNSLKSILTRIGEGSKIVVTGDIDQSDLGHNNGLTDFLKRYKENEMIKIVEFTTHDIERHPVVKEVLKFYD